MTIYSPAMSADSAAIDADCLAMRPCGGCKRCDWPAIDAVGRAMVVSGRKQRSVCSAKGSVIRKYISADQ